MGFISGALGYASSRSASNDMLAATDKAIDFQERALDRSIGEARRSEDIGRQLAAPQIETGGMASQEMARMMGFGTPQSMARGFNPATGMWEGSTPFTPSEQIGGGNALAVNAAAPQGNALAPRATLPPRAARPAGIPWDQTRGGARSQQFGGQDTQRLDADIRSIRDYLTQQAQAPEAVETQAPAPALPPVDLADPRDEQATAQGAFQDRQRAVYGDAFAGNDLGAYRDAVYGDFTEDPGYRFRQEEGQRALANSAAATTGALSGAAVKDAMRFNSGLASQEYNNWFGRQGASAGDFYNTRTQMAANDWNRLASMSGAGQVQSNALASQAAGTAAGIGATNNAFAANAGNALMSGAANAGNARMAGASALGQGIGGTLGLGLGLASGGGLFGGGGSSFFNTIGGLPGQINWN